MRALHLNSFSVVGVDWLDLFQPINRYHYSTDGIHRLLLSLQWQIASISILNFTLDRSVLTVMCHSCVNVFNELLKVVSILCRELSQCAGQLAECFFQGKTCTWTYKETNWCLIRRTELKRKACICLQLKWCNIYLFQESGAQEMFWFSFTKMEKWMGNHSEAVTRRFYSLVHLQTHNPWHTHTHKKSWHNLSPDCITNCFS